MTAPLNPIQYIAKEQDLITDFMQTAQLDHTLDRSLMRWADVHQRDTSGYTALYWAIYHRNMYNIQLLLEYGSTLEVSHTQNALFYAVACNNLEVLMYFIDKGIDINIKKNGRTLLEYATGLRRTEIIGYLKRKKK
jgi:ankyrin repeat protein